MASFFTCRVGPGALMWPNGLDASNRHLLSEIGSDISTEPMSSVTVPLLSTSGSNSDLVGQSVYVSITFFIIFYYFVLFSQQSNNLLSQLHTHNSDIPKPLRRRRPMLSLQLGPKPNCLRDLSRVGSRKGYVSLMPTLLVKLFRDTPVTRPALQRSGVQSFNYS